MSVTIRMDTSELDRIVDAMDGDVQEAVRPAAQAATQVIYDVVEINVAMIGQVTGNLASSIYQVFSKDNSGPGFATYHVSWNAKKAPHGHLVEYGHLQRYHVFIGKDGKWHTDKKRPLKEPRQVGAMPFIRPAIARFPEAIEWAKRVLLDRVGAK